MTHHGPNTLAALVSDPAPAAPPEGSARAARSGQRWTPDRMAAFLRALAGTHSVSAAAASVGMSRQSAYRLRARSRGKAFDLAWDEACRQSYANLAYAAIERALNGVEVPHYYKGELVGTSRHFDERLTLGLLRMAGNPTTLVIGPPQDHAALQGGNFAGLLASVEAAGEAGEAPVPEAAERRVAAADSANLSPGPDEQFPAELRRFEAGGGG